MELELLVFDIGKELWAVNIRHVNEVVKIRSITRVPGAPSYIIGVFNLRGQIVTLVSLSHIIGIDQDTNEVDKAIVIESSDEVLALAIKDVLGVARVDESKLLAPPQDAAEFVSALFRYRDRLVAVLNVDKLHEYLMRG